MSDKLTDKTFEKYCLVVDEYYCNGFNGGKAYQVFYPKAKDLTASVEMNRILKIPKVAIYVNEKHNEAKVKLDTSNTKVLNELRNWAYSDITETISLTPQEVKELPIEIRRLITKYKHTTRSGEDWKEEVIELSFVSKEKAMEMIHKHIGFYEADNNQQKSTITMFELPNNGRKNN